MRNTIRILFAVFVVFVSISVPRALAVTADVVDIAITNAGFESCQGPLAEGDDKYFNAIPTDAWRQWQRLTNGGPIRGWNPGVPGVHTNVGRFADCAFGGDAPEGDHVALVVGRYNTRTNTLGALNFVGTNQAEATAQMLPATFEPRTIYTLSAVVGHPPPEAVFKYRGYFHGYGVQLVIGGSNVNHSTYGHEVRGGTVIAEDVNSLLVPEDGFVTSTVTYFPDPYDEYLVGENLQIRLASLENPADLDAYAVAVFDDIKLTSQEIIIGSLMILR